VPRDELVQHRALGASATVTRQRSSGRAGHTFVESAREHTRTQWKFRAAIGGRVIAMFRSAVSDARTPATPSARDNREGKSEKHLRDVRSMLAVSAQLIDSQVLARFVHERGLEAEWALVA
jgi:hypothetical protein